MKTFRIGTRESVLAVWQADLVKNYLKSQPDTDAELVKMKTTGDKILDRYLDKVGGKGLFVKELDIALSEKRTELSVHSLKDLPMELAPELPLLGFSKREDPRDALVLPEGASEWDRTKPVGCSSRRRTVQLKKLYPELKFELIRGNVQTRLAKLDSGMYGATILAAAGLKRLGLEHRISRYFEPEEMIPAAGQGILAVQGREGVDYSCLEGFFSEDGRDCALAERAFVRRLDGGCSSPIAAHAKLDGDRIKLTGLYYSESKDDFITGSIEGDRKMAEQLGIELADELKNKLDPKVGKVTLVGAGPSDIGLLTVKATEAIKAADVVVYDALVSPEILMLIPEKAEKIDAGKRASNHTLRQEQTNVVLLEEALKGKNVVRLKGGDPFLFGRGGEELELLSEKNVPFEVIPGITSAISVPAYNGIPVTHRDYCSSLHIITGHKKKDEPLDLPFKAFVETRGTLVFLMGISAMADICSGLLAAGMRPDMPAAVLEKGTTAEQRRVIATISDLPQKAAEATIGTPAIIVVGDVCALADDFAWQEKKELFGCRVVVTRPADRSSSIAAALRAKGAQVIEIPAIKTVACEDNPKLSEAIAKLSEYQWIAFTSPSGVSIFMDKLKAAKKDVRSLGTCKIASLGRGTAAELAKYGIYADIMPASYDGENLGRLIREKAADGDRILLPRALKGNPQIAEEIAKNPTLKLDDIPTYDTVFVSSDVVDEKAQFTDHPQTLAVFTSASTVHGFIAATEGLDYSIVKALCIGKQTAQVAEQAGMQVYISDEASMEALEELVCKVHKENK